MNLGRANERNKQLVLLLSAASPAKVFLELGLSYSMFILFFISICQSIS